MASNVPVVDRIYIYSQALSPRNACCRHTRYGTAPMSSVSYQVSQQQSSTLFVCRTTARYVLFGTNGGDDRGLTWRLWYSQTIGTLRYSRHQIVAANTRQSAQQRVYTRHHNRSRLFAYRTTRYLAFGISTAMMTTGSHVVYVMHKQTMDTLRCITARGLLPIYEVWHSA